MLGYPPSRGVGGLDPRRAAVIHGRRRLARSAVLVAFDLDDSLPGMTLQPVATQIGVVRVGQVRRSRGTADAEIVTYSPLFGDVRRQLLITDRITDFPLPTQSTAPKTAGAFGVERLLKPVAVVAMGAVGCDAFALGYEANLVGAAETIQIKQTLFEVENVSSVRVIFDVGAPGSRSLPLTRVRGRAVTLQHVGGSGGSLEVPIKGSRQPGARCTITADHKPSEPGTGRKG